MKKVIDGALYNTETAQKLGVWDNGRIPTDFGYSASTLYRTKAGKFFKFREVYDKDWIEPLSPGEAREWAEEHMTGDEYIAIFGDPEEAAEGKSAVNLSLTNAAIAKLQAVKTSTGKSMSAIISDWAETL